MSTAAAAFPFVDTRTLDHVNRLDGRHPGITSQNRPPGAAGRRSSRSRETGESERPAPAFPAAVRRGARDRAGWERSGIGPADPRSPLPWASSTDRREWAGGPRSPRGFGCLPVPGSNRAISNPAGGGRFPDRFLRHWRPGRASAPIPGRITSPSARTCAASCRGSCG